MLPLAHQTAGPIGLKFFVDTHGWQRCYRLKKSYFFQIFFFHWQDWALQLVLK